MSAVTRRLCGRMDRIQSYAQTEVEATQELERAVFKVSVCALFFPFPLFSSSWGRVSTPTGCSPRDPGQLRVSWAESYLAGLC